MKKNESLTTLLDIEWQRSCALLMMQIHIEDWQFEYAIEAQLEFLYLTDKWSHLYKKHSQQYWKFKALARGEA